jgi:putative FmdB family regulatory protein
LALSSPECQASLGTEGSIAGGITVPTYAYACTTCDHRFEAQQSFSDDALTDCPECSGRLRKLFNSVGIVFKGSGFYRTDSRSGSSTNGSGNGAGSDTSSNGASESKPAAEKSSADKPAAAASASSAAASTAGTAA